MHVCVCVLVLEIRMIRANSPHSCPALRRWRQQQRLPLVCCLLLLLLLLLLFYSHSHIVYVCVCECIVSVFCHGHGLRRYAHECVYLPVFLVVCVCLYVLVRWGRRRSYVFACCSVGFDSVLDGWYGLALDRRLPACLLCLPTPSRLPPWLLLLVCCCSCFSSIYFALSICRLALADDDRSCMSVSVFELCVCTRRLCVCLSLRSCCLAVCFAELFVLQFCVLVFFFFFLLLSPPPPSMWFAAVNVVLSFAHRVKRVVVLLL